MRCRDFAPLGRLGFVSISLLSQVFAQKLLPTTNPGAVTIGTPTPVVVSALVVTPPTSSVISNSINLIRVDQNGHTLAVLGTLNDSGVNGDVIAGDGIYSIRVLINEGTAGQVYLRLSAAFRGQLRRTLSSIITLPVVPATVPTAMRPFNLSAVVVDPASQRQVVCNELLVTFAPGTSSAMIAAAVSAVGGTVVGWLPALDIYQMGLPSCDAVALTAAHDVLVAQPSVVDVEQNVLGHLAADFFPNDPLVINQWYLGHIKAFSAWGIAQSGATIGVVDSGVDYSHEDLAGEVILGLDQCASLDGNKSCALGTNPFDTWGHGTGTASVGAALANNGKGMAGVAFRARLIAEKIGIPYQGTFDVKPTFYMTDATVALGIVDAVARGARVVNLSLGQIGPATHAAVTYALQNLRVVVSAAGNDNTATEQVPASYPGVIAVGASDENNQRAIWSVDLGGGCTDAGQPNYASNFGNWVDVYAPGKDLVYATLTGGYATACTGGTSWATPMVSATASLMLAVNPRLTPSQVRAIIRNTATNTGNVDSSATGGNNAILLLNSFGAVQQAFSQAGVIDVAPTAGFLMTSGAQSVRSGQTPLNLTVQPGGSATVTFDGSAPTYSSDIDGKVVSWLWAVNEVQVSTTATFSRSLTKGTYQITLFVGDDAGTFGPAALGTIVVTEVQPSAGTVVVSATLDGAAWPSTGQATANYNVAGPGPAGVVLQNSVPATKSGLSPGLYTLMTQPGGGPPNSALPAVAPSLTQTLSAGGTITFTLQFKSNPPTAGFTMVSGNQSAAEGGILNLTVPSGGTANVTFDASRSSAVNGGTITGWQWSINGAATATTSSFARTLGPGSYTLSLLVTDSRGAQSTAATGTTVVTESPSVSGQWTLLDPGPTFPSDRIGSSFVYDPIRSVAVLFGGSLATGGQTNETWLWNGLAWTLVAPPSSPPIMAFHSAIFDEARGAMVLLSPDVKTWTWSGTTWTQKSPTTQPPSPSFAPLAYDVGHSEVVLLVSLTPGTTQTWVWNGTDWTQRTPMTSPPGNGSLAYDRLRHETIMFGGGLINGVWQNQTWAWDGITWTQKFPAHSPPPRIPTSGQSAVFDGAKGYMILYGGMLASGPLATDTWIWDGTDWSSPPSSLSSSPYPSMTFDSFHNQTLLFHETQLFKWVPLP